MTCLCIPSPMDAMHVGKVGKDFPPLPEEKLGPATKIKTSRTVRLD